MKPESIKFLQEIKKRAGHIPDVMSLVNSIFYEEGYSVEITKCPSCGIDWLQMEKDLNSPLEWVEWDSNAPGIPPSGFMGKSERKLAAEILCAKCSECAQQFKYLLGSL